MTPIIYDDGLHGSAPVFSRNTHTFRPEKILPDYIITFETRTARFCARIPKELRAGVSIMSFRVVGKRRGLDWIGQGVDKSPISNVKRDNDLQTGTHWTHTDAGRILVTLLQLAIFRDITNRVCLFFLVFLNAYFDFNKEVWLITMRKLDPVRACIQIDTVRVRCAVQIYKQNRYRELFVNNSILGTICVNF